MRERGKEGKRERGKEGKRERGKEGKRERGKEGKRERGKEGKRERGKEGKRERGKEGKRERGKEGKRERGKEGKRERGKEGKRKNWCCIVRLGPLGLWGPAHQSYLCQRIIQGIKQVNVHFLRFKPTEEARHQGWQLEERAGRRGTAPAIP